MSILSAFRKTYFPLNTIEVSQHNLLENYNYLSKISEWQAPVLKSNAYGHGIVQVATILDGVGAPFFCVDSLHEAYQLLKAKIKTPILIMGYINPENLAVKKLPFSYAVFTDEMLVAIKKYQPDAGVHIFVDTGMHREGVLLKDLPEFANKAKKLGLCIEGLMSHFAMADKPSNIDTKQQVKNFIKAKELLASQNIFPKYIHFPASLGVLHSKDYPKDLGNVGRTGIALFGIDPEDKNKYLKPVLRLISTISQIKDLQKGEKVGYDFAFTSKKNMKIAILPIGYNDGVNRKLSNKGFVKIQNSFCPIIGRVSMNITVVDMSKVPKAQVGDEVIIYSSNPEERNSILHVAKLCEIIPYEILVQLHASTKRSSV